MSFDLTSPKCDRKQLNGEYRNLLQQPDRTEQATQDFLETHSELIPTPWLLNHQLHANVVISKFPLDTSLICDFAYLTKSSRKWYLVFVELERPAKSIFTQNVQRVRFSAEFNASLDQISTWRAFISRHADEVTDRLATLRRGKLANNQIEFKYVLVYGRNTELKLNQDRIDRLNDRETQDLKILTYDSLINAVRHERCFPKNVLSLSRRGFRLKHLNDCYDTPLFTFLFPQELQISSAQARTLTAEGYQIPEWRKGQLLRFNHRYTTERSLFASEGFGEPVKTHNSRTLKWK